MVFYLNQHYKNYLIKFILDESKEKFLNLIPSIKDDKDLTIAMDGSVLRNSYDIEKDILITHMVNLLFKLMIWFCQEKIESKSNDITGIPKLLDNIPLHNSIITIDGKSKKYNRKIVK